MFTPITAHIEMDRVLKRVRKDGKDVHLTGLEYGLLEYLCTHPNKLCSRDELIDQVWGERFLYDPGTIDVHLNALRRKMGFDKKKPIETVRGLGLIFRTERQVTHYTIDLSTFLTTWLTNHEAEIRDAGLTPQLRLTPFVNQITISPEALRRMLDSILAALLPTAQAGYLKLSSRLTMQSFICITRYLYPKVRVRVLKFRWLHLYCMPNSRNTKLSSYIGMKTRKSIQAIT